MIRRISILTVLFDLVAADIVGSLNKEKGTCKAEDIPNPCISHLLLLCLELRCTKGCCAKLHDTGQKKFLLVNTNVIFSSGLHRNL